MALLATQHVVRDTPLTPTYSAVAATDTFVPGPTTFIHVKNAGGSSDTCTVQVLAGDPPALTIGNTSFSVPATTGDRMFGPFPAYYFADPVTGLGTIGHTFTTSVTIAVISLDLP